MSDNGHRMKIRSSRQVAYRVLALGALVMRGVLEQHERISKTEQALLANQAGVRGLLGWMRKEKLFGHLSGDEARMFRGALGKWADDDVTTASWRVEALGTLLWALRKFETLAPYDMLFDVRAVLDPIPFYEPIEDFVREADLRPLQELNQEWKTARLWHWRVLLRHADPEAGDDLTMVSAIADAARRARTHGLIPPPIGNDFPAFGKPFEQLTAEEYTRVAATAIERLQALNWLFDPAAGWDDSPQQD